MCKNESVLNISHLCLLFLHEVTCLYRCSVWRIWLVRSHNQIKSTLSQEWRKQRFMILPRMGLKPSDDCGRFVESCCVSLRSNNLQWHLLHILMFNCWLGVSVWKWAAELLSALFVLQNFPLMLSDLIFRFRSSDFCCRLQHTWLHMRVNQASLRVSPQQNMFPHNAADSQPRRGRPLRTCCSRWRPAGSPSDMQAVDCTNWRSANCSRHSTRRHDKNDTISHSFIKTKNQNKATVKVGLVWFLKALPLETKSLPKQTDPMKTSVEESLTWKNNSRRLKTNEERSRFSYQTTDSSVLRLFQCR